MDQYLHNSFRCSLLLRWTHGFFTFTNSDPGFRAPLPPHWLWVTLVTDTLSPMTCPRHRYPSLYVGDNLMRRRDSSTPVPSLPTNIYEWSWRKENKVWVTTNDSTRLRIVLGTWGLRSTTLNILVGEIPSPFPSSTHSHPTTTALISECSFFVFVNDRHKRSFRDTKDHWDTK